LKMSFRVFIDTNRSNSKCVWVCKIFLSFVRKNAKKRNETLTIGIPGIPGIPGICIS
jgi:hypothetical protein